MQVVGSVLRWELGEDEEMNIDKEGRETGEVGREEEYEGGEKVSRCM